MPIPDLYRNRSVYHFTHIENLPDIVDHGLLSTNEKTRLGIAHNAIAYNDIQCNRATMPVTCGAAGVVHDYVPLYFCIRSPMLNAVVTNKIADEQFIIYLEFPITIAERFECVFSDASANTHNPPNFYNDLQDMNRINWDAVDTWRWARRHDIPGQTPIMQAKMAELLIHRVLPTSEVCRIIVWNNSIRDMVREIFEAARVACPTIALGDRNFYFIDNGYPPVTGPHFINQKYATTIDAILNSERTNADEARYTRLREILTALENSLEALPETAELIGLGTENPMHGCNVGEHTLTVVNRLAAITEFEGLQQRDRRLVILSAYLHDIGKGPRTRWPDGVQKVDEDHPIKALPMLQRILVEELEQVTERSVRILCKLVCYHDIIGGIIGRGRRAEELEEIIEDETELNMLIALCKADIRAVNFGWCDDAAIERVKERVLQSLRERVQEAQ